MGKQYRTTLDLKEGEEQLIRALCLSYRGVYNKTIDIQFDYLTYSRNHSLMDKKEVEKYLKKYKGIEEWYPKKLDEGIVKEAINKGTRSFKRWWKKKLYSPSDGTWAYPRHLSLARAFHFYTSTNLNVSKGGFIYFPKVGRIKLGESNYIPEGSYKNAKVQFDGKKWRIQIEDLNEEVEETNFLRESLEVSIDRNGSISMEDTHFSNVIEGDTYIELLNKLLCLRDKLSEAKTRASNETCKKIANNIMYTKTKMKDVKASYFRSVSKQILQNKPRKLIISAAYESVILRDLDSPYLRASSTRFFVEMLKRKAERMGIEVIFKGIDDSIFIDEN